MAWGSAMHYDPDERAYYQPEPMRLKAPISWCWCWLAVVVALGALFL